MDSAELIRARAERERRRNPDAIMPGMEGEDGVVDDTFGLLGDMDVGEDETFAGLGVDDAFSGSSTGLIDSTGGAFGDGINMGFGDSPFGGGMSAPQPAQKNLEDTVFEAVGTGAKASMNFFRMLVPTFKQMNIFKLKDMGKYSLIMSGAFVVLGLILAAFKLNIWGTFVISGGLGLATGTLIFMLPYLKIKREGLTPPVAEPPQEPMEESFGFEVENIEDEPSDIDVFDNDTIGEVSDTEEIDIDTDNQWIDTSDEEDEDIEIDVGGLEMSKLDALGVSREELFRRYKGILPHISKNFAEVTWHEDDDALINFWTEYLVSATDRLRTEKSVGYPVVVKIKETAYTYVLTIDLPKWVKDAKQAVDDMVAEAAYDSSTNKVDSSLVVVGEPKKSGNYYDVIVMRGADLSVSIKDTYMDKSCEEFVLNEKNKAPVVYGVDELGNPQCIDMLTINSLIVAGQPRSGKSWALLAIFLQMMMYCGPSLLNFYFCDVKYQSSDFYSLQTGHVKKFAGTKDQIVALLKWICDVEAPRRKKVLGNNECSKIEDYNSKVDDADTMPYIYIVIDEVIGLMTAFGEDKEGKAEKKEFEGYLKAVVTQFPSLGIRLIIVPHKVDNSVISKLITDMMACRIVVKGDAEQCEKTLKTKKFTYNLGKTGDMGVKLDRGEAYFSHSTQIVGANAKSKDNIQKMFEFVNKVWELLEPDEKYLQPSKRGSLGVKDAKKASASVDDFEDYEDIFSEDNSDEEIDLFADAEEDDDEYSDF